MSDLIALDVAVLLPPDVEARAIALSASLPESESQGLRLDADHRPHVTLVQQFVRTSDFDTAAARIDSVLHAQPPLLLTVSGAGASGRTVWMTLARTPQIVDLHERLMHALRGVERHGGTTAAFVDRDARPGDVRWVSTYRRQASFGSFTPHVTLGHAAQPPRIEPFDFEATTVAACHLGRFCACRTMLRAWMLTATASR